MASVASPYGLRPINLIGGQAFNGGVIREYKVASNNSAAIFNGDLVVLSTAGLPSAVGSSPVAIKIPATSADATAGIVGVCVGARYTDSTGIVQYRQYLPANLITGGATDVFVRVMDDPDALFQVQGTAALGTFNSGTDGSGYPGAIGKNAALGFVTGGSTATGNSGVNLVVGANGGSLATTSTLAVRIVDVVQGTQTDVYPEFIVKLNVGVHSYNNPLGV
jgi:hypothetical protein